MKITKERIDVQQLFIIAYSLALINSFLSGTMLNTIIPVMLLRLIRLSSFGLIIIKVLIEKKEKKKLVLFLLVSISIMIAYYISKRQEVYLIWIYAIGASNVDFKKIVKTYFKVSSIMILIIVIFSRVGLIENLVYYRTSTGTYRQSFGFNYPTNFVAYLFYLELAYLLLKNYRIGIWDNVVIISIGILSYVFCNTRLDSGLIILTVLIFDAMKIYRNLNMRIKTENFYRFFKFISKYSFIIFGVVGIGIDTLFLVI